MERQQDSCAGNFPTHQILAIGLLNVPAPALIWTAGDQAAPSPVNCEGHVRVPSPCSWQRVDIGGNVRTEK